jgi:hypothetical protein
MSNHHFKEKKMSLKAKGILSLMLSLPDDWNYSISGLVTLSKDGRDSVMSALAELEEFGYLKRVRTTDDKGRFTGVEYNIYETPQKDNPIADERTLENSTLENPNSEKRGLLNTNHIKNLKESSINELSTKDGGLIEDAIYEILLEIEDNELRELYMDYVLMRNSNGSTLKPKGLEMLIARGNRLSNYDLQVHRAIVETAVINNWMNLYAPKQEEMLGRDSRLEEHKRIFFGEGD